MPDALELPGMLSAVIPLVRRQRFAGLLRFVIDELVAHAHRPCTGSGRLVLSRSRLMPCLAAVVRTLNDLSEPAAGLRSIQPIRISGRSLDVIDLPTGKMRAADGPFFPLAVRRKNKCALPCANEYAYFAHLFRSFLKFPQLSDKSLLPAQRNIVPLCPKLAPQGKECTQPFVAQVNPSPDEHADIERKQHLAEERISGGQLDRNRAAQIPGQQDRPKDRRAGNHVKDNAKELDNAYNNREP